MIGERLNKLRKEKKLTQDILGEMLSVTKFSISMYENNKNIPTEEKLVQIAKIFSVSVDYLVGLIDEPYSYLRDDENILRIPKETPVFIKQTLNDFVEFLGNKYNR